MAIIAQWNSIKFEVSPSAIKSFNDLMIKATLETETTTDGWQKYEVRKAIKPIEISMTVRLTAGLGYNVRSEAENFTNSVYTKSADYFYVGGKKLHPSKITLVEATISKIEINADGTWASAEAALSFRQSSLLDGTATTPAPSTGSSSSGGGGGYSAAAGSKKQTVTPTKTTTAKTVSSALTTVTKAAVTSAVSVIKSITTAAKKVTAAKAATPKAGSGGGGKVRAMLK